MLIEPFLGKMNEHHFEYLIKVSNENPQVYERRRSKYANDTIIKFAQYALPDDFDYSLYINFKHSDHTKADENNNSNDASSDEEPEFPFTI